MEKLVKVETETAVLEGKLNIPQGPIGLVIFAHGSGSSHLSPRNAFVADELQQSNLATLLIDLLTEVEDLEREVRFDIEFITKRLMAIIKWAQVQTETRLLPIGLFGASTGTAAALIAAARLPTVVRAIVSRGGRPDLAMRYLNKVTAPTLLIVGGEDYDVIALNEQAHTRLNGIKLMELIAGATHLFEEPGSLKQVAELAASWFYRYLHLEKI